MADDASTIRIRQIPPYDGEYEFDLNEVLTTREWRWIKQISGYMPLTIDQGLRDGDPDAVIAFAVIAMRRAGKIGRDEVLEVADKLADAPFDESRIAIVEPEVEESPPALTPEPERSLLSDSPGSEKSSGDDSTNGSEKSDGDPSPTGTLRSPMSLT